MICYDEVKDEEKRDDKVAYFGVILIVEWIADESDGNVKAAGFRIKYVDDNDFENDPEWISRSSACKDFDDKRYDAENLFERIQKNRFKCKFEGIIDYFFSNLQQPVQKYRAGS